MKAYIIESGNRVTEVTILDKQREFYLVGIGNGAIRLRSSRVYFSEEEAKKRLNGQQGALK